ncbi:hypothetical protein T484DRAFT_1787577 [Baffinella frigidus]|nr:hypothetical protein T484DRAFT_1787577 [Cryptophyta sp. CCMP2293]
MSLSTNANQHTDATSKAPFGCMTNYNTPVFTDGDIEVLSDLDECLLGLKSDKFRNQVIGDRNVFLAWRRVDAFVGSLNSAQCDTVHCTTSHYATGDWDLTHMVASYVDDNNCLVCGTVIPYEVGCCVHQPFHDDCLMLEGESVVKHKGRYTHRLASFIRNDAKYKAEEDATTKSMGERKALIVLRRLERQRAHWFVSAGASTAEASTY